MFKPSDVRRVQAAFEAALPLPYEASVTLDADRLVMRVAVTDPDDAAIPVVQASWGYETLPTLRQQPRDAELAEIAQAFVAACNAYTALKTGA